MKRIVALLAAAVVTACAAQATHDVPRSGTPARIDVSRLLAQPRFASVLAQYDADIATLRRAQSVAPFASTREAIANDAANVDGRLANAARNVRGVSTQPLPATVQRAPRGTQPAATGRAVDTFAQALDTRLARAHELRASQLREHEATVAYDFERAHAGRTLMLRLKLQNLHSDPATRRRYSSELASLEAQEEKIVGAERARDAGILAAYDAELRSRDSADLAVMSRDFSTHLQAMRNAPRESGAVAVPAGLAHDSRPETIAALNAARRDITARFAQLRTADGAAADSIATEIAALQRERNAIRERLIASITAQANRIAAVRGMGTVYTEHAPSAAIDLTNDVARALP